MTTPTRPPTPARTSEIVLVTGAAGFIGFHLCGRLLRDGARVVGIDNLNSYYDVTLKQARLDELQESHAFSFRQADICEEGILEEIFREHNPTVVVNLAAQAEVRYSITNPEAYVQSNVVGFLRILEACRHHRVRHLLYASSSSVYGGNTKVPFEESDNVDHPVSLYAATKKSNELMADCYSHLYGIPATGLRFFTVYGPYGRPDMAYFNFLDRYFAGQPIHVYNDGDLEQDLLRDFTYIDDVVESVVRLMDRPPTGPEPHQLFNIGNSHPQKLTSFIGTLEACLSRSLGRSVAFDKVFEPRKPGDVPATYAATERLQSAVGYQPHTPLEEGLQRFTDWYIGFFGGGLRGSAHCLDKTDRDTRRPLDPGLLTQRDHL